MVLMVFFSSRISPRASTSMVCERSPRATAVVTWAMLRTCWVRLVAIRLTLSVRSFQVPATPGTVAWPPSRPSVPTSRATLVTSEAKPDSWSTMVLTVFFSSSISPATCTVTLRERSPLATAVVTQAMSRTCAVSRPAIMLTESVRSFQLPETPRTRAWPPSLPSVPTSMATRVTSSVNSDSESTSPLTVRPTFRNSPRSGWVPPSGPSARSSIRCSRSPSAIEPSTRPTSAIGRARSSIRALQLSTAAPQAPSPAPTSSRSDSRPSRPTSRRTRASSPVRCWLRSAISLKIAATSAMTESPGTVSRLRKFPSRIAVSADSSLRRSAASAPRLWRPLPPRTATVAVALLESTGVPPGLRTGCRPTI